MVEDVNKAYGFFAASRGRLGFEFELGDSVEIEEKQQDNHLFQQTMTSLGLVGQSPV